MALRETTGETGHRFLPRATDFQSVQMRYRRPNAVPIWTPFGLVVGTTFGRAPDNQLWWCDP